jgi:hypothetical protein
MALSTIGKSFSEQPPKLLGTPRLALSLLTVPPAASSLAGTRSGGIWNPDSSKWKAWDVSYFILFVILVKQVSHERQNRSCTDFNFHEWIFKNECSAEFGIINGIIL